MIKSIVCGILMALSMAVNAHDFDEGDCASLAKDATIAAKLRDDGTSVEDAKKYATEVIMLHWGQPYMYIEDNEDLQLLYRMMEFVYSEPGKSGEELHDIVMMTCVHHFKGV